MLGLSKLEMFKTEMNQKNSKIDIVKALARATGRSPRSARSGGGGAVDGEGEGRGSDSGLVGGEGALTPTAMEMSGRWTGSAAGA